MVRLLFITLSFSFFYSNLFTQIIVTDINKNPIPFVQITSSNPYFFLQTDLTGQLYWSEIKKLNNSDTLFFHHISYEKVSKTKKDLLEKDTIILLEQIYNLKEFEVNVSKSKKKYQKISACYRSFQIENDTVTYYTDGNVEYLSKIGKDNYSLLRKEYRTLSNKKQKNEHKYSIGITFLPTIPQPPFEYIPSKYIKKHNLISRQITDNKLELYNKDSILIGNIEITNQYIKYSLKSIHSNNSKALKTEVNITKYDVVMLFRKNENIKPLSIKSFDDLVYTKTLREYKVKHKKDNNYLKINNFDELFIENVFYDSSSDNQEYLTRFGMPKESHYNSEFWKFCNCQEYYPPYQEILKGLYEW